MSGGRWEPFDQLTSLREAMGRLIDQSFTFGGQSRDANGGASAQTVPVNIFEAEDVLMVTAPMPGLQQEDVEITVRGNSLTLEGGASGDLKPGETGKRYLRHEWRYGPYHRTVELPYAVESASAEATLGNGVLTIRLTKAATERSHKINVKTGA